MFKDSHQLGLEWEAANAARAQELNDMLDACPDLPAKRALYQTFAKEERNGLMPEYGRRAENRRVMNGMLVKPSHAKRGIGIRARFGPNSQTSATYYGLALVIGQEGHGGQVRYLMLLTPWENREGLRLRYVEAQSGDLEVVC